MITSTSAVITMLYVRSPYLLTNGGSYPLTNISPFSLLPHPWQSPFFSLFLWAQLIVDWWCGGLFLDSWFCSIGPLPCDKSQSYPVDETPGEGIYDISEFGFFFFFFGRPVFRQIRGIYKKFLFASAIF